MSSFARNGYQLTGLILLGSLVARYEFVDEDARGTLEDVHVVAVLFVTQHDEQERVVG